MATRVQITFDARDPQALGEFWADVLGYVMQPPPEGFDSWADALAAWGVPEDERNSAYAILDPDGAGPRLFFQKVPEAKTAKNRVHLDVTVTRRGDPIEERRKAVDSAVARVESRGATRGERFDRDNEYWVVMADPEGNEFCVQ
jgi:hypothetical protein